jgi:hypothetical protein
MLGGEGGGLIKSVEKARGLLKDVGSETGLKIGESLRDAVKGMGFREAFKFVARQFVADVGLALPGLAFPITSMIFGAIAGLKQLKGDLGQTYLSKNVPWSAEQVTGELGKQLAGISEMHANELSAFKAKEFKTIERGHEAGLVTDDQFKAFKDAIAKREDALDKLSLGSKFKQLTGSMIQIQSEDTLKPAQAPDQTPDPQKVIDDKATYYKNLIEHGGRIQPQDFQTPALPTPAPAVEPPKQDQKDDDTADAIKKIAMTGDNAPVVKELRRISAILERDANKRPPLTPKWGTLQMSQA